MIQNWYTEFFVYKVCWVYITTLKVIIFPNKKLCQNLPKSISCNYNTYGKQTKTQTKNKQTNKNTNKQTKTQTNIQTKNKQKHTHTHAHTHTHKKNIIYFHLCTIPFPR